MECFKIWMICAAVCVLDSVVLEQAVTSCEGPTVIKNMTSWYVNALCNVQEANSSRDNYSCQLLRNAKVIETQKYSPVNNVTSTCNFTTSLPTLSTTYTYEIIVAPGAVKEQIGNVAVASPSETPRLDCSPTVDGFFKENKRIFCTCTAANLGQPTGNLIGYWNGRVLASENNNHISWRVTAHRYNDGGVVKCVLKWITNLTTTLVINVTYPPSRPDITYASQSYPFMEGETPKLFCHFPAGHEGNPPATLTLWSSQSDKVVGQGQVNVTLTELTYLDNNKMFFCTAKNAATTSDVRAWFKMQVYYKPNVTLTRQLQDACRIDPSDPRTCVVEEGERVLLSCHATGFPEPLFVAWQRSGTGDLELTAQRRTKVEQVCEASTARLNGRRLPLRSSVTLRVLVKYQASIKSFRANNTYTTQFTANETDPVSLACIANGRPTPNIRILKGEGEMKSLPQGQVTAADEMTLTYLIPEVRCEDAGEYRCVVTNGQGTGTARFSTVTLTVNCKATESSGGLSGGAMAGIAVAVVMAVIIAVLGWLWWRYWTLPTCLFPAGRKRRRTKENAMETNQKSQDETDLSTVDKGHIYSNMEVDQHNKQVGGKQKKKRRAGRQSDRENGGKDQDNADCKPYENWSDGSRNVYETPSPRVEEDEDLYDHIPDQPGAFALMPPGYRRPSAPTVSTTGVHVYCNKEEDSTDNPYANFGRVAAARKRLEMLKLETPK
ncbi:peroxidasin homolog [Littorina saxatilis]|uniref:peroxidasin homolog n=1 Tax=Littorina saxatilis TaxID=31220 RepID=UPI0038B440F3